VPAPESSAGRLSRISNWKKRGIPAGIGLPALLLRFFEVEKRQDRNSQLPGLPLVELQAGRGPLDKPPQSYRERYEARLKEIAARGQRESKEFLALLEAEYRSDRSKPKGSSETEWGSGHYFRTLAAAGSLFCNRDVHPADSRPHDSAAECRSYAG
jgi:hypothetical protein